MPILYNCRHSGDQYRITKFDADMNPQGSYLLTLEECECPAGVRPSCRHRQMLPKFIARGHVGDEWFFDFDRGGWVQMGDEWKRQDGWGEIKPEDIGQVVKINLPAEILIHESITSSVAPPSPTHIKRRF